MNEDTQPNAIVAPSPPKKSGMAWSDRKAKLRRDFERELLSELLALLPAGGIIIKDSAPETAGSPKALFEMLLHYGRTAMQERDDRQSALGQLMKGRDEANKIIGDALQEIDPEEKDALGDVYRRFVGPVYNAAATALRTMKQERDAAFAERDQARRALRSAGFAIRGEEVVGTEQMVAQISERVRADVARAAEHSLARLLWDEGLPAMKWLAENANFNLDLIGRTRGDFTHALRHIRDTLERDWTKIREDRKKHAEELQKTKNNRNACADRAEQLRIELENAKRETSVWKLRAENAEALLGPSTQSTGPW